MPAKFKDEAKVYRVRIDVEVVACDRQDAEEGAREAWINGGSVDAQVEILDRAPSGWMAYSDDAVEVF